MSFFETASHGGRAPHNFAPMVMKLGTAIKLDYSTQW